MADGVPSILERLSRTLSGISLLWGIAVALVVGAVVDHEVDEIMDATLRESAQILQPLLSTHATHLPIGSGEALPAAPHKEEVVWQIVDVGRGVVLRSHDAPTLPMVDASAREIATTSQGWRVLVTEFDGPDRLLMTAQVGVDRREAKLDAIGYIVGAALLVGVLCAAWQRARVRRELQPLTALTEAVSRFDPLRPDSRLAQVHRQELKPVRDAIVSLGERLAGRVAHERAFSAHAAHAMRTPLAGLMAQLAAAQRATPDEARAMLALARQAADRLRRVVGAILTLFRSGSELNWERVDLVSLMSQLQVEGLEVQVQAAAELEADPDLLAAALANLLDNAVRLGAKHVEVECRPDVSGCCIALRDDGPGLEETQRQLLQEALDRRSYQSPVGMGLMLADLVARAHGGALRVPKCDEGCVVELRLGAAHPSA